jgi:threonine/homoserine/homoserine lactone efflux protein
MEHVENFLTAFIAGLVSGFVVSIPVGPINITIINEGARRGFVWACMIGLGAMVMDLIYCGVAFAGFSGLFSSEFMKATMELLSFLFLIYLGMKYLLTPTLPATTPTVEAVEHTLHPHAAFWIGFVRVLGNPAVLLFWITVSATFISHEWINDTLASKASCVLGTFVGGLLWFLLLSFLVAQGHGKFSTTALVRMAHVSGAVLLVAGMVIGFRLVTLLSRQHQLRRHERAPLTFYEQQRPFAPNVPILRDVPITGRAVL